MCTRLFLVEGLPGSGKSTTAKLLCDCLIEKGIEATLFCEGDIHHPADYEGVAYLSQDDYAGFIKMAPSIAMNAQEVEAGYLVAYRDDLFLDEFVLSELIKRDVYECPLSLHQRLVISKWKQFVVQMRAHERVVILECCFLQNPLTVSLVRDNASIDFCKQYVLALAHIVSELHPVLIYLEQEDIKSAFLNVKKERPSEWYEGFCTYYTERAFGKENELQGLDGVLQTLEHRRELEYEILNDLKLHKVTINTTRCHQEMVKARLNAVVMEVCNK